MNARELLLLSPYRYPAQNSLVLAAEDMAAWMNAWTALWHPAVLWQATAPPKFDTPYDYEQPRAGQLYALPESPPLILPDDWEQRCRDAGALFFKATPDRTTTLNNLFAALGEQAEKPEGLQALLGLDPEKAAPFFGLGLGFLLQASLAEAMEHENLLEQDAFWQDVQAAAASLAGVPYETPAPPPAYQPGTTPYPSDYDDFNPAAPGAEDFLEPGNETTPDGIPPEDLPEPAVTVSGQEGSPTSESVAVANPEAWPGHLQAAGARLLSAREVLYPVTIHLLDFFLLDETRLGESWPEAFSQGMPINVIASGHLLEKLAGDHPQHLAELRERAQTQQIEICGGCYREREDPLLPLDSQLWNLHRGQAVTRELLGVEVKVFARRRFGFSPNLPLLLTTSGITKAILLAFDESGLPSYQSCLVSWPSPDGKQVDAFVRKPHPADNSETWFNLGYYLFKTTREDHVATIPLLHTGTPGGVWYRDWLELGKLGPVMGQATTLGRFFSEVTAGEFASSASPDEFHFDYLSERGHVHATGPVSNFARHLRLRRRLDSCWTLAALLRSLAGRNDPLREISRELEVLEQSLEQAAPDSGTDELADHLLAMEKRIAGVLAGRLQARSQANQPGYLLLNPCGFTRRVALEVDGGNRPPAIEGPVKACQLEGNLLRAVVEVPPLGFAWFPREGPTGTPPPVRRMLLADKNFLRNEFFEAEIDPITGGLKAIRDHRTQLNRLGQRLVFNPGSTMQADEIKVTSSGPALGEIVAEGTLKGEQGQVLARFRQRFRAWLSRPLLEIRIELTPEQPPAGYPWHAYFGSRFAWRDERAMMLRSSSGTGYITTHTRPQTPDFLELRLARQSTVLFPGGLPFHQRHEGRMLDMILLTEGEKTTVFELGIGLDREQPMQTALGMVSPVAVVATDKGPPHIGASGWLFHLDAPNLLLSQLRPGPQEKPQEGDNTDRFDSVTARLLECGGHSGQAELRCVRDPRRAVVLDAKGGFLLEAGTSGDAVFLEVTPNDLIHVQIEFGEK